MASDPNFPRAELVQRCLAGEPWAWESLVGEFAPFLKRRLISAAARRGIPFSEGDADDLVAKVWEDLLRDDRRLLRTCRFGTTPFERWLLGVGIYRLLHLSRGRGRDTKRLEAWRELHLPSVVAPEAAGSPTEREEARRRIDHALRQLPPEQQLAVSAFYEDGWPHRRIARVLRIPVNRVGPLLAAARDRLRDLLRPGTLCL